ncbi:hypothetical protein [Gemmatimonas sp.]|jgi:hypothetical protein|uniref:hypothetical protein n=1 Tax=Gemmatimonas sp. TaxID=1962908 RepID=UPI0022C411CA|nr:hypothetical protein [Gemmatimonas sp.]MCZ8204115.1 hypothetical protein [Gemmatimonas sp.]
MMSSALVPRLAILAVVLTAGACRRTDLTDAVVPVAATSLSLQARPMNDSVFVDVVLGGAAPQTLGSITGEVAHAGDWTFVQCEAQQADALLACKAHGATVRVAAAWAAGTHAGALVRLAFVRATPSATPTFMLAVSEAHGARGMAVLDSVEVKRQSVVAGGAP